ncbi:hypothetical protein JW949_03030 [Candidatus Woesearchaeota archaeon]|nr:hypothetical protein [Candidatus Woesearchaeota archaeon]
MKENHINSLYTKAKDYLSKIEIPSREEQDEWIKDVIYPLFNFEFGKAVKNTNKKIAEIQTERMYKSLLNLERNGTSWENIEKDLQEKILSEDYKKPYEKFVRKVWHKECARRIKDEMRFNSIFDKHRIDGLLIATSLSRIGMDISGLGVFSKKNQAEEYVPKSSDLLEEKLTKQLINYKKE